MSETKNSGRGCGGVGFAVALLGLAALSWWYFAVPEAEARLWRTYRLTGFLASAALSVFALAVAYVAFGGAERKRRVFRVILAGLAAGLCLGLVEAPAFLGHDYRATFGTRSNDTWLQIAGGVNRADPELIHVHQPHSSFEGRVLGNLAFLGLADPPLHDVSVQYDHNGFRNAEDLEQAPVVAIGDSFIEAAIVREHASVSGRLSKKFGEPVANLGQAAYGFRQELAVLRRYGLPLKPKVVLWFVFGGNDFRDADHYDAMREMVAATKRPSPLRDRVFIGNALLALSAATTTARTEPSPQALSLSGKVLKGANYGTRVYFGDGCPEPSEQQWKVGTDTLAEAQRLCAEANAHLLVIFITRKYRVYRDHVEFDPGSLASGLPVNGVPERLATWCAERELAFMDLSPALEREVAAGRHPYHFDDVHWNEHGHAVVAAELAVRLVQLGWLEMK